MSGLIKSDEELEDLKTGEQEPVEEPEEAELDSGFELEVVDPSEYGNTKPQALIDAEKQLAELTLAKETAGVTKVQQEALTTALQSVQQMQSQLAGGIKVNQPEPEIPKFDRAAHFEKFNKNIYNNPGEQTEAFMAPYLVELNKKIDSVNQSSARNSSKAELLMDESARKTYATYKDEIEEIVKGSQESENVYQKALQEIRGRHFDEFVAEEVAKQLAIPKSESPPLTNIGKPSAPAGPRKAKITPGMQRWMHDYRMKGGGDTEWALGRATELKKSGVITD